MTARPFDPATYRSPIDVMPDFSATEMPGGGWSFFAIEGGVAVVMPSLPPSASRRVRGLYAARRDANLTGICPACGAKSPPVVRGIVSQAAMHHRHDCPVSDPCRP